MKNKIFIFAFLFLYLLVAAISFFHAIEFFSIGNVEWMSVTLAFAFELGLAVCLCSILLGNNKNNTVAWFLLVILVIVQVCGNTYSVFKFIATSEEEYYQYLAKPLLFWIQEVSEETVQIIVSWIMGAILPIVALLMTEMVSQSIKDNRREQNAENKEISSQKPIMEDVSQLSDDGVITNDEKEVEEVKNDIPQNNEPPKTIKGEVIHEPIKPVFPLKDPSSNNPKEPIVVTGDIGNLKGTFER